MFEHIPNNFKKHKYELWKNTWNSFFNPQAYKITKENLKDT